jgi:hypothetical protein
MKRSEEVRMRTNGGRRNIQIKKIMKMKGEWKIEKTVGNQP